MASYMLNLLAAELDMHSLPEQRESQLQIYLNVADQRIREKGIKLDPQNAAFCEKRAVLFYDRKKVRDQRRIRNHDRLAEERSTLGSADIEDIAKSRKIL